MSGIGLNCAVVTCCATQSEDIAICTIEKANAAVNKLVADGRLGELVCIIVDEVHMVSDEHRCVQVRFKAP